MIKFHGKINKFDYSLNLGHTEGYDANIGSRLQLSLNKFKLGASLLHRSFREDNDLFNYEFDLNYTVFEEINIKSQLGSIDDGDSKTEDLNYFALISYKINYEFPHIKTLIPYIGYSSKDQMEESNLILGLRVEPMENAYCKFEYNKDSIEEEGEKVDIQFGYLF